MPNHYKIQINLVLLLENFFVIIINKSTSLSKNCVPSFIPKSASTRIARKLFKAYRN